MTRYVSHEQIGHIIITAIVVAGFVAIAAMMYRHSMYEAETERTCCGAGLVWLYGECRQR